MRFAPLVAVLLAATLAFAQDSGWNRVPEAFVSLDQGAITVIGPALSDSFVPGLGWISGGDFRAPRIEGGIVYLDEQNLARFGLRGDGTVDLAAAAPAIVGSGETDVRFGGDVQIRVVVDLPQLPDARGLASLEGQGELGEDEPLILHLPGVEPPVEQPEPYRGLEVRVDRAPGGSRLELRGPGLSYRIFALESPTRLVIDVLPLQEEPIRVEERLLREGVLYRTFGARTGAGSSRVHVVEISPGHGDFRVVGTSEVPRTLEQLVDGAFLGINAGYFDTSTFASIGLLTVDYGMQSLPSRNRASIAFGSEGPVIERVSLQLDLRVDGRIYRRRTEGSDAVQLGTVPGLQAGSPRRGALVVSGGRVVANRVGPVTVPEDGFVVSYPPDDRDLALIDPGATASIGLDFEPDAFDWARYAVEAGPLLVEGGRPAYDPAREAFAVGERILDAYTQQSAIGVRPDGTVLLLIAESMRAQDLVPLFLSLGAEAAMRLDSGSSAGLIVDGKMINRAAQRRIVSAIVYLPRQ